MNKSITIELTSKKYKAAQLIIGLITFAGIFPVVLGITDHNDSLAAFGFGLWMLCLLAAIYVKFRIWWDHE